MKKHDVIAIVMWLAILSALIYNIGIVNTLIILLVMMFGAFLYIGVP